ncbi:MAG: hypothetical protein AB7U85_06370 [Alphaproteobacteria bacterium]
MAEEKLDNEIKQALEAFFDSQVSIYEAGEGSDRPKEFLDRPFVDLLPASKTYFVESLKQDLKGDGSYALTVNEPFKNGSLDTKASKTFQAIEERFNKVKPDQKLFVIDADSIRSRYAMDESFDRSLGKSIIEYVKEKKLKYGVENNFPAAKENVEHLIDSAFKATSAFSRTQPANVTEENLKGDFCVSLVVVQNPDDLQKKWMVQVPGVPERMERDGLTHDNLCRFTIYHEFGHALDDLSNRGKVPYLIEANPEKIMTRYRKECFADAHAVLQMARDDKHTRSGELLADIRISNVSRRVLDLQGKKGKDAVKPDIEKKLEKMQKAQVIDENESKSSKAIRKLEEYDEKYSDISKIGDHMAYYTTPVVDAAVEFAKKGLADGSLLKMSDEEVLKACRQLVNDNTLSNDRMSELRLDIFKGNFENPDIKTIQARSLIADNNMPIPRENILSEAEQTKEKMKASNDRKLKAMLGIPVEKPASAPVNPTDLLKKISDEQSLKNWSAGIIDRIEESGYTKEGIIKITKEEKDEIRQYHGRTPDTLREAKLKFLNDALLAHPDVYIAKSKTRVTVRNSIESVKTVGSSENRENTVSEFLKLKVAAANYASDSVENAMKTDLSSLSPEEFLKAKNREVVNYNKTLIAEKTSQEVAFAICRNKEEFDFLRKTSPSTAELVQNAAKKRHPSWMEDYHMAFASNDKSQLSTTLKKIAAYGQGVVDINKKLELKEQNHAMAIALRRLNDGRS